jgi:hypothetical protein
MKLSVIIALLSFWNGVIYGGYFDLKEQLHQFKLPIFEPTRALDGPYLAAYLESAKTYSSEKARVRRQMVEFFADKKSLKTFTLQSVTMTSLVDLFTCNGATSKESTIEADSYNAGKRIYFLQNCADATGKSIVVKEIDSDPSYELIATINEKDAFLSIANSPINAYVGTGSAMGISKTLFLVNDERATFVVSELAPGKPVKEIIASLKDNQESLKQFLSELGRGRGKMDVEISTLYNEKGSVEFENISSVVHGDFHPGNIFYDENTKRFTTIDNSGLVFSAHAPKSAREIILRDLKAFCEKVDNPGQLDEECGKSLLTGYQGAIANSPSLEELLSIFRTRDSFDFAD